MRTSKIRKSVKNIINSVRNSMIIFSIILNIYSSNILATSTCSGRFVNPITDICWECVLPITIGGSNMFKGDEDNGRDTKNPNRSLCACSTKIGNASVPVPGLSLGFWEPVRLVDVTRTPYCLVNLGGVSLMDNEGAVGSGLLEKGIAHKESGSGNYHYYNIHSYIYPLIYWFELLSDLACAESGSFDLGYMSEFDPSWNNDFLSIIMAPESVLFANPIAQIACTADSIAASVDMPLDKMFWCAGGVGSLYPLSGRVRGAAGGVQASVLLAMRMLAKEHRTGLALVTSTDDDTFLDGELCSKHYSYNLKKSQYKLQMTYPKVPESDSNFACVPLGMSDIFYNSLAEFLGGGEDFGFLIWRKKNCCFL